MLRSSVLRPPALLVSMLTCAAAIGVTAAAPAVGAARVSYPTTTTLSVLAFNVDLATAAVDWAQNQNAAGRQPAIEAVIRRHSADVVILDELFNQTSTDQIPADLHDLYPYHTPDLGQVCSGGGWDGVSGDCSSAPTVIRGGTMILSKYPIMAQYGYSFNDATSFDLLSNKGAVLAQVDKNGTRTWVVGTHLQADQSGTSVDTTSAIRVEQMAEIKNFVNATVGAQGPVLIGGDLNIEYFGGQVGRAPGDSDLDRAEASGNAVLSTMTDPTASPRTLDCLVSAWCQVMAGNESFPSNQRDSLDYLGYLNYTDAGGTTRPVPVDQSSVQVMFDPQPGWTPGMLDTFAGSDHYPIMSTFYLGRTAMPSYDATGLDISGGDDQRSGYLTGRPDWDPGAAKGSCIDGERLIGLSHTNDLGECTDIVAGTNLWNSSRTYAVVQDERNVTWDWAVGYTKDQCPVGYYASGWSRNGSTIDLLCAAADRPLGTAQTVRWFDSGDNRGSGLGGDWAFGQTKGQCADDEYIAGVAYSQHWYSFWLGQPWALLCQKLS